MELSEHTKKILWIVMWVVIAVIIISGILLIAFIKSCIGCHSASSINIQEQISLQILDDLRTGNKKVSIPYTTLNLEPSEESVQAIGIKNFEDNPIKFITSFQVKSEGIFSIFKPEQILSFKNGIIDINAKITWDDSPHTLNPGESRVFPITITAPDKPGNYLYKIIITKDTGEEYDSRTFFIKTAEE
ncbi:MAG: hypothetical protein A2729_03570 [Candidatus Buchananbacteria bacterium RIFCSPHIGHO2_01_FULL_39_14]|uniref:Uncharacterized protein n=1 Tax=Candidatus Buchananbacteria bacterium RIFCSPHIGHO2_01_FULL_39_14 TaxID=1797532 RepID=A0A1G1XWY2_9BACT|nr:MAG: hypothetical protein A2729_03570 [Candidatus Buchananbacteria bacterium RIFCSPHIGHO2_01_FULL_39_14]